VRSRCLRIYSLSTVLVHSPKLTQLTIAGYRKDVMLGLRFLWCDLSGIRALRVHLFTLVHYVNFNNLESLTNITIDLTFPLRQGSHQLLGNLLGLTTVTDVTLLGFEQCCSADSLHEILLDLDALPRLVNLTIRGCETFPLSLWDLFNRMTHLNRLVFNGAHVNTTFLKREL
jgi:hypothetical protein